MDKLKILIVEDDKSTQQLYDKALSEDAFEKRFSGNGIEALEVYQSWKPDIIILDIFLPLMTGYLVLREIRVGLKDNLTTIIMSTSLKREEDIKSCIKYGIQGYIIKPIKYKEIYNKITEYYQTHKKGMEKTHQAVKGK